jgi:hypothetical protein
MTRMLIMLVAHVLFLSQAKSQIITHVPVVPGVHLELIGMPSRYCETFQSNEIIRYALIGDSERSVMIGRLTRHDEFLISLVDTNGNSIPKRIAGASQRKPLDVDGILKQINKDHPRLTKEQTNKRLAFELKLKHAIVRNNCWSGGELPKPDDYFVLTTNLPAILEVQMRFWVKQTNGEYGIITTPQLRVRIEKGSSDRTGGTNASPKSLNGHSQNPGGPPMVDWPRKSENDKAIK